MHLRYLDFDFSEDAQGHGSFDAMATATVQQMTGLEQEILRVLEWADDLFPHGRAPLEEGGEWDAELQATQEVVTAMDVEPQGGRLVMVPRGDGLVRFTITLTISGTPAFCEAFREAFPAG